MKPDRICFKSSIGFVLLEATDRGVCRISFSERKPQAPQISRNGHLRLAMKELREYFAGKLQHFSFRLHAEGTTFQKQVWSALRKVPYGETRSYSDIAKMIGNPAAVRAVGGANNQNPLPIVVPCHRVIGKSGKLVGYAGGLDRKSWLLERESFFQQGPGAPSPAEDSLSLPS